MSIFLAYHSAFLEHDSGPGHPEYPARIEAVMRALEEAPWADKIVRLEAREATPDEIAFVHDPKYVTAIRRICEKGGEFIPRMEAALGEKSYHAALRAAGAGMTIADEIITNYELRIMNGQEGQPPPTPGANEEQPPPTPPFNRRGGKIGFAPVRPPGHHATFDRPMGFCVFNNVAILARYIQRKHGLVRIAIVDFDVHHGNGTEEAFWTDPTVLYISLHRADSYPYNKGRTEDSGEKEGRSFTLNVPMPAGSHDREYLNAFDRYVTPKLDEFAPQFLLASAGFDAHYRDPLGGMRLTDAGYAGIARRLKMVADNHCGGCIISLLEGGYDLQGLAGGVTAYLGAMIDG